MSQETENIANAVQFQAHLQKQVSRLAKQRVRTSDPQGQIHVKISGQLQVQELVIAEEALSEGAEALAERLLSVFNEALQRANELAASKLTMEDSGKDLGLPQARKQPKTSRREEED